jgi:hypothetical protein
LQAVSTYRFLLVVATPKICPVIMRSGCHQQYPRTENLHVKTGAEGGQRFKGRPGGQLNGRAPMPGMTDQRAEITRQKP